MAVQDIHGHIEFPPTYLLSGSLSLIATTFVLDAGDEKAALVFRADQTRNIRQIHFRTGAVTTGATLDLRVETVSATDGTPTGTLWATNTNVAHVLNASDDNVWLTSSALTADASVTRGDLVAIVIVNPSASPGNFQIAHVSDESHDQFPYGALFTASWAKQTVMPDVAVEYSDGTFAAIYGHLPISAMNTPTFNNTSTPDERGNRFILPFACRAAGVWFWHNAIGAGIAWDAVLYDTDGSSVLASVSFDSDQQKTIGSPGGMRVLFNTTVNLSAATANPYRLVLKPTSASNVTIVDVDVAEAAILDVFPGGQAMHHTERTDAGSWSDTTTKRDLIGLILDGL